MSPKTKRIALSPDQRITALLALEGAESVTEILTDAADVIEHGAAELEAVGWSRAIWCLIADALNGYWHTPGIARQMAFAAEITDGHRLADLGAKWLAAADGPIDDQVAEIAATLHRLSDPAAYALHQSIRFFWRHTEIDASAADWWTVSYRRRYLQQAP